MRLNKQEASKEDFYKLVKISDVFLYVSSIFLRIQLTN